MRPKDSVQTWTPKPPKCFIYNLRVTAWARVCRKQCWSQSSRPSSTTPSRSTRRTRFMLMMLVSHIKYLCMHCERNTCQITINIFSGSSSSDPPPKSDIFSPINLHRLCPCSSTGRYICARIGVSFVIGNDHHHHYSVYKCDLLHKRFDTTIIIIIILITRWLV